MLSAGNAGISGTWPLCAHDFVGNIDTEHGTVKGLVRGIL